ncbi:MAG: cob(I)yrinic acid a,c-diamide adenosyltransferase [Actinomycetota bacterium]|nr:cob(I)yrinic acid a,c-diamide adenosyltransferase [Actinomycetota bacterium]
MTREIWIQLIRGSGSDVGADDPVVSAEWWHRGWQVFLRNACQYDKFTVMVRIYTRKGDDGTTGLLFGGRVRKDSPRIEANGVIDEAQAAIGVARAEVERGAELDGVLGDLERDLWVLMAEVATAPENRGKLAPGSSLVTPEMVIRVEGLIDEMTGRFEQPTEFVLPGQTRLAGLFDQARTVVRRAERCYSCVAVEESHAGSYLNRLSDLLWVLARYVEQEHLVARPPRNTEAVHEHLGSSGR